MTTPAELQQYLHEHIPLSRAMQVSVVSLDADAATLQAPLAPNINHRETAFGGSISTLAILAAWSLLQTRLAGQRVPFRLVIQRNDMDYLLPITDTFSATATLVDPAAWDRQLRMLARRGVARFAVEAQVRAGGELAGRFSGEFVALAHSRE